MSASDVEMRRRRLSQQEKIIILFDTHEEMLLNWNGKLNRISALKEVMLAFIGRKGNSPLRHMFAIVTFYDDKLQWLCDFTRNQHILENAINSVTPTSLTNTVHPVPLNLSELLKNLTDCLVLKNNEFFTSESNDYDFCTRCIFIFSRSKEIPILSPNLNFFQSNQLFFDIIYVHRKSNEEDGILCQEIFDKLTEFQLSICTQHNYLFETHASPIKLFSFIMALMAHPIQRNTQKDFLSKLEYVPS